MGLRQRHNILLHKQQYIQQQQYSSIYLSINITMNTFKSQGKGEQKKKVQKKKTQCINNIKAANDYKQ